MANLTKHYRCLENLYQTAPFNDYFHPVMEVSEGRAVIEIELKPSFQHAGGGVHGSVYFKMLDDAAYFAANSLEEEFFLLTTSFTTYLTRPVSEGVMKAIGKVVNKNNSQFIAEAVVYDSQDREIGRGNGIFVRSKNRLADLAGYAD
ncbi:MAG: PaaI family thioesterase [Gammaproteobacteria bacterium]|nr:PaaI family thioesterase [Gammaproteobacteria bacterium]